MLFITVTNQQNKVLEATNNFASETKGKQKINHQI